VIRLRAIGGALILGLLGASFAACHRSDAPEERVRKTLERAQRAVADEDLGVLLGMVSDDYADEAGRDREAIVSLLRRQLVEHGSIHLLTRVQEIVLPEAGRAEARVLVAAGALPLSEEADLSTLRADLYRFEITLEEEEPGRWMVVRAAWRRAAAGGLM